MAESLDEIESKLLRQIDELMRQHQKQLKPYIEALIEIRSLRPLPPIMFELHPITDGQRLDAIEQGYSVFQEFINGKEYWKCFYGIDKFTVGRSMREVLDKALIESDKTK